MQRLKVPPSINQFSKTLDKNQATELLKVLMKYQPEDKKAKQQRLKEIAAAKEAGKEPAPSKAPKVSETPQTGFWVCRTGMNGASLVLLFVWLVGVGSGLEEYMPVSLGSEVDSTGSGLEMDLRM